MPSFPAASPSASPRKYFTTPLLAAAALALHAFPAQAADVRSVQPVTARILAVRILDGHTAFYDISSQQIRDTAQFTSGLLDTAAAETSGGYALFSTDDPAFAAPVAPLALGRKSRPWQVHSRIGADQSATAPHHALREHWIYLEFPEALEEGCTYALTLPAGLVSNGTTRRFVFDSSRLLSPAISVGQAGFTPDAPKFAFLGHWMGSFNTPVHQAGGLELGSVGADGVTPTGFDLTGAPFQVVDDATGEVVFVGAAQFRRDKTVPEASTSFSATQSYSQSDTWELDFSALAAPGRYRVVVPGMGCSVPFEVRLDAYRAAFRASMLGIAAMRSGIVREAIPGTGLAIPRGHHSDDAGVQYFYDPDFKFWLNPSGGSSVKETNFDFAGHPLNPSLGKIYGWYYDAGDWDAYQYSHLKVPLALLVLYDFWPENFRDGDVGVRYKRSATDVEWIDEGTNGVPDLIDEARWLIDRNREWRETLIANGLGTGGFPGYLGRDAGVSGAPWQDTRPQAITAEDPESTYGVAAALAALAYSLDTFHRLSDPAGRHPESEGLVAEAIAAYAWANGYVTAHPTESTKRLVGFRMAAAAALFRITGEAAYNADFLAVWNQPDGFTSTFDSYWYTPPVMHLGELIYAMIPAGTPGLNPSVAATIRSRKLNAAQSECVDTMQVNGYRLPMRRGRLQQGAVTTPAPITAAAHWISPGDAGVRAALHAQAAYHLGGNELRMSHMTGIGQSREFAPFLPLEWAFFASRSMAYPYRNLPGITLYNRASWDVAGHSSENANYALFYPPTSTLSDAGWPYAERRSNHRWSIAGSEFTVHELFPANAWVYGALCDPAGPPLPQNLPPDVVLAVPEGAVLPAAAPTPLVVTGSPDLARVEYFLDWRFIGESSDAASGFRVVLNPSDFSITPGASHRIIAVGYDRAGEFSWEGPGVERLVRFESVTPVPVESVSILGAPSGTLSVGRTYDFDAVVFPTNATFPWIAWRTTDPTVATVDDEGLVTVHAPGSFALAAISAEGATSGTLALVAERKALTGLALVDVPPTLGLGGTLQLGVALSPPDASDHALNWSSSDPSILEVDANGWILGLAAGIASVTVSGAAGALSATSIPITVLVKPMTGLGLVGAPTSALDFGQQVQLRAVFEPIDASESAPDWSSSAPEVIAVDSTGLVTAIGPGVARITARVTRTGIEAYVDLVVTNGPRLVLGESDFTTGSDGWTSVRNINLPVPVLTGGDSLRFVFPSSTNLTGGTIQSTDWNYVLRRFPPVGLRLGDRLTLSFTALANSSSGNLFRQLRGLGFSLIGPGSISLPSTDVVHGTPGDWNASSDYTFTSGTAAENASPISLGMAITFGGTQVGAHANHAAVNSQSDNLLKPSSGGSLSTASSLAAAWAGSRVELTIERLADLTHSASFRLTTTAFQADGTTYLESSVTTLHDGTSATFGLGESIIFSGLAIGSTAFTQIFAGNTSYGDLVIDDVCVILRSADAAVPAPPAFPVATAAGARRVELVWIDASSNETGFQIERSIEPAAGFVGIGATASGRANWSDTGVEPATVYFYRVRAVGGGGVSAYSEVVSATTDSPHEEWLAGFDWSGADSSDTGDPDGDGLSNLLEYAFGLDPRSRDSGYPLTASPLGTRSGIAFRRALGREDLSWLVEGSTDLNAWVSYARAAGDGAFAGENGGEVVSEETSNHESTVRIVAPALAAPAVFLRVRVAH